MKKIIASLAFGLLAAANCSADVIKGEFTTLYGAPGPVASYGDLTLSLNADGTVAANLHVTGPNKMLGVSIDTGPHYTESSMSPDVSETSWWTSFGVFNTGLWCSGGDCGYSTSWNIGNAGQFTSAWQLLTGTDSSYDFFLYTTAGEQYVAMGVPGGDVPEPGALALVGLGLAGLAAARRKAAPAR